MLSPVRTPTRTDLIPANTSAATRLTLRIETASIGGERELLPQHVTARYQSPICRRIRDGHLTVTSSRTAGSAVRCSSAY
jgi:hypothetical protein